MKKDYYTPALKPMRLPVGWWKPLMLVICLWITSCGSLQPTPVGLMAAAQIDARLIETRYCGKTDRDPKVAAAFKRQHACPVTGLTTGACPDWQIDHVIPIDVGGCDSVSNMQWLPVRLKTCAGHCKDRWERKIYCKPLVEGGTGCVNSIIQPLEP